MYYAWYQGYSVEHNGLIFYSPLAVEETRNKWKIQNKGNGGRQKFLRQRIVVTHLVKVTQILLDFIEKMNF